MVLEPIRRSTSSSVSSASSGLRIGDAEREQAVESLGGHLRAGRLTVLEYDERLQQAFAARTEAELTPLFADLPGGAPRSTPPPGPAQGRNRRTVPVPLRVVVVLALIAAAAVASIVMAFPGVLLIPLFFLLRYRFGRGRHYGRRRRYDYAGPRRY